MATIYIASSSNNRDEAQAMGERLEAKGHTIDRQWWHDIDKAIERGWMRDAEVEDDFARGCARRNLSGVARCHVMVFLDTEHKSFGAALEIGYAVACGKPVFALGAPHGRIWERMGEWVAVADESALDIAIEAAYATSVSRARAERRAL